MNSPSDASRSQTFSDASLARSSDLRHANSGCGCARASGVCWGAIFAGVSAALALQVLFMMLGAGLGFALYNPLTADNPIADLGMGAVFVQGFSAIFSLWFGGWVAGRFARPGSVGPGWLHGFTVWCAATVAGVLFVSAGAGWALGDLSKIVGGGLSAAGQPAAALAAGAGDLAKDALKQSGDTLASFGDEMLGGRAANATAASTVRAKREVGLALGRHFAAGTADPQAARDALVQALVTHGGMSSAVAEQTVVEWTATYERLKADLAAAREAAETKARELADEAASALAVFSLCVFVGFALGALAASWGGCHGASCALRCAARAGEQDTLGIAKT